MAISTETQRLRERYQEKLEEADWTAVEFRILETAIADRLQLELPGNQVPFYPNIPSEKDKDNG